MTFLTRIPPRGTITALSLALLVASTALAQTRPPIFSKADRITVANPDQIVEATVWLALHDRTTLDDTVAKIYEPDSPTFHHWLKSSDLDRFTPSAAELATVKAELKSQGLSLGMIDGHNMFVRVSGPVSAMQTAFHTEIMNLTFKGEVIRSTTTEPKLGGAAGALVASVSGLTENRMQPQSLRTVNPATGKAYEGIPVASLAAPDGLFFASDCFRDVEIQLFRTPGATLPAALYGGNRYGADLTNTADGTLAPCAYDAAEMATAYHLPDAWQQGLDGTGQTIVIIDAFGSTTLMKDANLFSQLNGLPQLTSSNFAVSYPAGPVLPTTPANAQGWANETTLDVEWAHAIAPGANILVLVSPDNSDSWLQAFVAYAVESGFGSVISNSYGSPELENGTDDGESTWNTIIEFGAALGASVNFATGDNGDLVAAVGYKSVSVPADSPYATAVGGTSLALNPDNSIKFQTGWGNNISLIDDNGPLDPPQVLGFIGGSGGGKSAIFAKPSWQSKLPGANRQLPDVSMDADPYTGVELIVSENGGQYVLNYGGTSLACPMFSAFWAIANQRAAQLHGAGTLLGQAAPIVARIAGTKAIDDIQPIGSYADAGGIIADANGLTWVSPNQLAAPEQNIPYYLSDLFNAGTGLWFTITFGTDSSLSTARGWDNVTGYGTPHGLEFINAAAK